MRSRLSSKLEKTKEPERAAHSGRALRIRPQSRDLSSFFFVPKPAQLRSALAEDTAAGVWQASWPQPQMISVSSTDSQCGLQKSSPGSAIQVQLGCSHLFLSLSAIFASFLASGITPGRPSDIASRWTVTNRTRTRQNLTSTYRLSTSKSNTNAVARSALLQAGTPAGFSLLDSSRAWMSEFSRSCARSSVG